MSAPPLFATPSAGLPRETEQVATLAAAMGTPLIPWQRQALDVATQRRPDGSYEHQVVVVSVPRQCGKTVLLRALAVYRSLVLGRSVFYTAQTGKDARARWADMVDAVRDCEALAPLAKIALRGGSEHLRWLTNNQVLQCFAPTPKSLHGYTPPLVLVDEAFAQPAGAGDLLMGAIGPAQLTIPDKQIWLVSTRGTADSSWFHGWIDQAMEGTPRVAGLIWGAADDHDPYSLADIARFHPGVGQVLNGKRIQPSDVLGEASRNTRSEYERAYANRATLTESHLIPLEDWRALRTTGLQPPANGTDLWIGYDVALNAASGGVVVGWTDPVTGRPAVYPWHAAPGVGWMPAAVDAAAKRLRPRAVVAAGSGPGVEVNARVQTTAHAGPVLRVLGERDYARASGGLLSLIREQGFTHPDVDQLNQSAVGLVTRASGDGVALSRRLSVGDSSLGIATALVLDALTTQAEAHRVVVRFG